MLARRAGQLARAPGCGLSTSAGRGGWRCESQAGAGTEVHVYTPDLDISWPEPQLGVLAAPAKHFPLPGNTGAGSPASLARPDPTPAPVPDIVAAWTKKGTAVVMMMVMMIMLCTQEVQVHVLDTAHQHLASCPDPRQVLSPRRLLPSCPLLPHSDLLRVETQPLPVLLRRWTAMAMLHTRILLFVDYNVQGAGLHLALHVPQGGHCDHLDCGGWRCGGG